MDKVVILFSTYNNERTIEPCLRSCMGQNYKDLHIVIADDGSNDRTVETIRMLSTGSAVPVTVLELPHGERGVARVRAVEEAKRLGAEYIFVLDSDMILAEHLIQQSIDFLMIIRILALWSFRRRRIRKRTIFFQSESF